MSVERAERRVSVAQRYAPPVAAVLGLAVLVIGLSTDGGYYGSRWPLSVSAVILGVGLGTGPVVQRVGGWPVRRLAQTVAALAALVVLVAGLSSLGYVAPRWPLALTAVLLSLGLAAAPLARLTGGRAVLSCAPAAAAVLGLLVLVIGLATTAGYFSSRWPLEVPAVILGVGLGVGSLTQRVGGRAVQWSTQPVAAVAALAVLVDGLSSAGYVAPRWPLTVTAVILGLGLVAGPLAQFISSPREELLSERVDELSRTRRGALDVQASELRRIERDLHDGAQARLVALSMKLGRAEDRYRDDPQTAALLREAREDAAAAIRELRELARGIAPPVLTDRGLEAAVRSLADRSGAQVTVSGRLARRPLPAVETAAYFVVAESLTNAAKHARGTRVEVRLDERGGDLFVEVTDFGPGEADPAGGGLTGLRQRVEALDGALHVLSPAGVGTQVEAMLPCGW